MNAQELHTFITDIPDDCLIRGGDSLPVILENPSKDLKDCLTSIFSSYGNFYVTTDKPTREMILAAKDQVAADISDDEITEMFRAMLYARG